MGTFHTRELVPDASSHRAGERRSRDEKYLHS
jgi:hypothetical protein